ncbi:MAG: Flp family type IVb pilin [Rhodospirillales bacterium]|nr:Flp family type IVb pilin [Rhodospirillales bacterium]MCB9994939.1 Flp family type IVb pilin [Rhodospirillales bacterium]
MLKKLYAFLKDTSGATGVEYSLLIGFIGVTVSTGAFLMGDEISTMFEGFSSYLDTRTIN